MTKKKKKLTPAQKVAKKKRQKEYMTVFMNGKRKRVKRPQTIDGMDVDEFIRNNADPIWLHQNEMWEYIEPEEYLWEDDIPTTEQERLAEIEKAYLDAFETIPFGPLVGQELTPKELFHLAPVICLKFREIDRTDSNLKKATEAALSSYVASHFGLDLIGEIECTNILNYVESNLGQLVESTEKSKR